MGFINLSIQLPRQSDSFIFSIIQRLVKDKIHDIGKLIALLKGFGAATVQLASKMATIK